MPKITKFDDAMLNSTKGMNVIPLFHVFFIGVRCAHCKWILQMVLQKWAQNCFAMCAYVVIEQVLISIIVPLVQIGG